jgi:hypothetical protein
MFELLDVINDVSTKFYNRNGFSILHSQGFFCGTSCAACSVVACSITIEFTRCQHLIRNYYITSTGKQCAVSIIGQGHFQLVTVQLGSLFVTTP